ncbi:hypothetical protein [Vagococcus hydrophili]|uniref:Uncharacterized protein n=1 Tax=Vagococcus hydrophili TaxID=2714947 RepID=A0A6G8AV55_9ENTE|nr:hypothetical protein [Vagococcus hydrophili]QIL48944.1 hypothetical protein G7082_10720 [Vagococcus hydrophili]
MTENAIDKRRNASSSWSGFIHQGKVGFLVALRELKKCIKCKSENENYEEYKIFYENAEDFDIVDDKNNVISRHQVKAYYSSGEERESYSELFYIQTRKIKEVSTENEKIKEEEVIEISGYQIHSFDGKANILKVDVSENKRYVHVIKNVPDFYLTKKEYLDKYTENGKQKRKKYTENESKIRLYPYSETEGFCPLSTEDDDKIKEYCCTEIKEILKMLDSPLKETNKHPEDVYYKYVASILDNNIGTAHEKSIYPVISFEDIVNLITTEIAECDVYLTKNNLTYIWGEYKLECIDAGYEESILEDMELLILELLSKEKEDFEQFIRKINPHEPTSKKISIIFNQTVLRNILFLLFEELNKFNFDSAAYIDKNEETYRVSLISDIPAKVDQVIKKIIRSKETLRDSFDMNYLINQSISGIPISDKINGLGPDKSKINYKDEWKTGVNDSIFNQNMEFLDIGTSIEKIKEK